MAQGRVEPAMSDERESTRQWFAGCTAVVLLFGSLVGGVTSCTINATENETRVVQAACMGDLHSDAVRSASCILALTKAGRAGR